MISGSHSSIHSSNRTQSICTSDSQECMSGDVSQAPQRTDLGSCSRTDSDAAGDKAEKEPPESLFYASRWEVGWLVFIGSLATCVSSITTPIYFPALNVLAVAFNTSVEKINLTATMYSIFQGISPLVWGTASDQIGRRPVFILCIALNLVANLGLAFAKNYWTLFGLRILQAFGGASTISLGFALVGDITQRSTRGGPVGTLSALGLMGTCFGPVIGAALMSRWGWSALFWFLVILAGTGLIFVVLALPETSRHQVGRGTITPERWINRSPYIFIRRAITGVPYSRTDARAELEWRSKPHPVNYFAWLSILKQPDVLLALAPMSLMYTVWYMALTALSTTLDKVYGLSTTAIGFTFLSSGAGTVLSSLLAGYLMQYEYRTRRNKWEAVKLLENNKQTKFDIYRARLGLNFYALALMILSTLIFAWTLDQKVSFYVPVVMTFFISAVSLYVQSTTTTLLIDLFPDDSAAAVGCCNLTRCLLCAAGLSAVDKMDRSIGIGVSFSIMSGFLVAGVLSSATLYYRGMRLAAKR